MPTNKNAQYRYQILDRCLSNFGETFTIDDLLCKVNDGLLEIGHLPIKIRQLRDDIAYMRADMEAPIEAYPLEGKKCFYRYDDQNFSIYKNELTDEELQKLRSAIEIFGRYRGLPDYGWLDETLSSLECRFGVTPNAENIVSFEQNQQLRGLNFLSQLIDAAINHKPLEITNHSYHGCERTSVIHPYHLKQYNNRWFLLGLEEAKPQNRITNKALDRIICITPFQTAFIPNKSINFSSYFNNVVGVTIPDERVQVEKIILRFDEDCFPYVVSKPIHSSQKVISERNHTIQITLRPNKELESRLMSFIPQIEVLQPQWFRLHMMTMIKDCLKKYESVQDDCTSAQ